MPFTGPSAIAVSHIKRINYRENVRPGVEWTRRIRGGFEAVYHGRSTSWTFHI